MSWIVTLAATSFLPILAVLRLERLLSPPPCRITAPLTLPPIESYFVPAQTQSFGYDFDGNSPPTGYGPTPTMRRIGLVSMVSQLGTGLPNGNTTLSFTYDYLNRRVEKKVSNTATQNLFRIAATSTTAGISLRD